MTDFSAQSILVPVARKNAFFHAVAAFACVVVLACVAAGCARKTNAEIAAERGILLIGNSADPESLDPTTVTGLAEAKILRGLFEGLVAANPDTLEPEGACAKSWKVSADGLKYVFHLDPESRWSNGARVEAGDFVFAWRRAVTPAVGAEYASMLRPIKNAAEILAGRLPPEALGVRAPDSLTLEVELAYPSVSFLDSLACPVFFPLYEPALARFGARQKRNAKWTRPQNMVCNGAFTLSKWSINDSVVLRKNPFYRRRDEIFLNEIRFFPISNINTEERAFRTGQLHITDSVAPARLDSIRRNTPDAFRTAPVFGVYYYMLNCSHPALSNPDVRRALSMAIDRRAIIDSFLKAGQAPAFAFVPPNCGGFESARDANIAENVAEARELLKKAGYPDGRGLDGIKITYNTSEQHKPIAEAIQAMWRKNLGFEARLYNMSWPAYLAARRAGDFDVARASWFADYRAPESFLELYETSNPMNRSRYSNADFDAQMEAAKNAKTSAARLQHLREAERTLLSDGALIPIYFYSKACLVIGMVKNWHMNALDWYDYRGVRLVPPSAEACGKRK